MKFEVGPSIVRDGLILYLDAGNVASYTSGSDTWYDLIGVNNFSGSLSNGPTFDTGSGGSIVFDGVDDYVTFLNCNFNTTTEATFLFISTNNSTNQLQTAFGWGRDYWEIRSSQTYLYVGYGGIDHSFSFERSIPFNNTGTNWRHLAVRVTGSTGTFFKDGARIGDFTGMPSTIDSNPTMFVGRRASGTAYYYNGSIAVVQVYNRALLDQEVFQNYNAQKSRFSL